jgi:GT2 family glycosyltransferase
MAVTIKAKVVARPNVDVDIIIPFHAGYDHVHSLCMSIWKNTVNIPYHVYLVDDCSPNNTFLGAFRDAPRLTCVRTEKHSGFGAAVLEGFQAAYDPEQRKKKKPAPWVVILHSDVVIESVNWLQRLFASYEVLSQKGVAMVSARSDSPGTEQLKAVRTQIDPDFVLEEGFLPLYCVLFERELFHSIGGINPYPYAMYEDEEFAYRLQANGLKQGVSGRAWVHHEGGVTIDYLCRLQEAASYEGPDFVKIMESNRDRCVADIQTARAIAKKGVQKMVPQAPGATRPAPSRQPPRQPPRAPRLPSAPPIVPERLR